jgi:hypothetical protein
MYTISRETTHRRDPPQATQLLFIKRLSAHLSYPRTLPASRRLPPIRPHRSRSRSHTDMGSFGRPLSSHLSHQAQSSGHYRWDSRIATNTVDRIGDRKAFRAHRPPMRSDSGLTRGGAGVVRCPSCSQNAHIQKVLVRCAQSRATSTTPLSRCLEPRRRWSLMISCARAKRGLRRPSLDARR